LLLSRRQTGGQYVAGLRLGEDGLHSPGRRHRGGSVQPGAVQLTQPVTTFPFLVVSLLLSRDACRLFVILTSAQLRPSSRWYRRCSMKNRTLHDRIAGAIVVPAA
jgi:hypothetical protein